MIRGEVDRRPALVIEHERPTPAGLINDWLADRGLEIETLAIDEQLDARPEPRDYELIVSLGSEFPAYDDGIPWIASEMRLLGEAVEADVPVLGVCFGGQLLARVLGGDVFRSASEEIGWLPVRSSEPELVSEGPWFQWHFDSFTVPETAITIAASDIGPQAFTHGRSLGVQFHPEVTPEIMERWVAVYRHELDEHGVDPDGLLAQTKQRSQQARRLSYALLDRFHDRALATPDGRSS